MAAEKTVANSDLIYAWASESTNITQPTVNDIGEGWVKNTPANSGFMNWVQNEVASKINHPLQHGISVWSVNTTYAKGDYVTYQGQGYRSLIDSNLNIAPDSSPVSWAVVADSDTLKDTYKALLPPNTVVTVGGAGDFKTIQEALNYLSAFSPWISPDASTQYAVIKLLKGFIWEGQVVIQNQDFSWVFIIPEDTVTVKTSTLTTEYAFYPAFASFGSKIPLISGSYIFDDSTKIGIGQVVFMELHTSTWNYGAEIIPIDFTSSLTLDMENVSTSSGGIYFNESISTMVLPSKLYINSLNSCISGAVNIYGKRVDIDLKTTKGIALYTSEIWGSILLDTCTVNITDLSTSGGAIFLVGNSRMLVNGGSIDINAPNYITKSTAAVFVSNRSIMHISGSSILTMNGTIVIQKNSYFSAEDDTEIQTDGVSASIGSSIHLYSTNLDITKSGIFTSDSTILLQNSFLVVIDSTITFVSGQIRAIYASNGSVVTIQNVNITYGVPPTQYAVALGQGSALKSASSQFDHTEVSVPPNVFANSYWQAW